MKYNHDAIIAAYPQVVNIVTDDVTIAYDANGDSVTIDETAIAAEITRLQAEYDAKAYARSRAAEYPAIGDQLDALWKGGAAAEEMLAAVMAVKSKYPKPE